MSHGPSIMNYQLSISRHRATFEFLPSLSITRIEWSRGTHYTVCASLFTYSLMIDWDQ